VTHRLKGFVMPALLLAGACAFSLARVEPAEPSMIETVRTEAAVQGPAAPGRLTLRGMEVGADGTVTLAGTAAPGATLFVADAPVAVDGAGVWTAHLGSPPSGPVTLTLVTGGLGHVVVIDLAEAFPAA